jgi:DNA-binding beta-propeller fold protein YncE
MLVACSGSAQRSDPTPKTPPAEGVLLLNLETGALIGQRSLGADPLAVTLAPDGQTAYVADNDLGDVFALRLPSLREEWRTHVGGAPGGLLVHDSALYVSEYDTATVAQLDAASGRQVGTQAVAPHPGQLVWRDGVVTSGGEGFGVAEVGGELWTGGRLRLAEGLKPFWLQAGRQNELLVTAEGSPEDTAPGAVMSIDTNSGAITTLATPRDPDQAIRSGGDVFVAAHGDHEVLVLRDGTQLHWARGAEVVALAPDPALNLLVVVADADE